MFRDVVFKIHRVQYKQTQIEIVKFCLQRDFVARGSIDDS